MFSGKRRDNWRALTLSTLLLIAAGEISAADPPAGFAGAGQNMVTEFKGKLKGFQRGVLLVSRDDGTEAMVQLPDAISNFTFVAQAKPAFLRQGTLVRFSGAFGPTGIPVAPIDRVEVFQPVPVQQLVGHVRERYQPGVYPVDPHAAGQQQAIAKYNVVGGLMGINAAGIMMVRAGNTPVQAKLAADATFELHYNNLTLAQEGDPVSVAGFYQAQDDTKVKAERITITTDRVYGEPVAAPPKRTRRSRTAEKEDKDGDKEAKPGEDKDGDKEDKAGEGKDGDKEDKVGEGKRGDNVE